MHCAHSPTTPFAAQPQVSTHDHSLELVTTKTEPRVDSRTLAKNLDNTHRATVALLDKYLEHFQRFGQLTFKKAVGERLHGGGNAQRYALLNEDQAFFLLSLSRNTARVVELKARLVRSFANARRNAQQRQTEYLPEYHRMHNQIKALVSGAENERLIHMNFNKLINKTVGIEAGQRDNVPIALLATAQLVATQALSSAENAKVGYAQTKVVMEQLHGLFKLRQETPHG